MTTLYGIMLAAEGHNVKSYCVNFEIKQRLFYPFSFKGKFSRSGLASVHTTAINDPLTVIYTDTVGNYYVFAGKVTKISPDGVFTTIEATSGLVKAFSYYTYYAWSSATNHDAIITDLLDSSGGPSLTVNASTVATKNSFPYFIADYQTSIDAIRTMALASADGASDAMTVVYQDAAAADTINVADFGDSVPATDITLSHSNGAIMSKVVYADTSQEIVNNVVAKCQHGIEDRLVTAVDGTSDSITKYGKRVKKIYLPGIISQTPARFVTDTILRKYSQAITRMTCDVKHSALHANSTHYPVVNTLYTIVDSLNGGVTTTDICCIEHVLRYPSFRDTCVFSTNPILADMTDYMLSSYGNQNTVERTASPLTYETKAYRSTQQTIEPSGWEALACNIEVIDLGERYNVSTGLYDVPVDGIYTVSGNMELGAVPNTKTVTLYVVRGGVDILASNTVTNSTGSTSAMATSVSWTGACAAGDDLYVYASHNNTSNLYTATGWPTVSVCFRKV